MCGDLEEQDSEAERLYGQFLFAAQTAIHDATEHRGGNRARLDGHEGPLPDKDVFGYMDGLFADVLGACLRDAKRVSEPERYRVLSSQAVVLAKLAGFLAGHLDLREDPLRTSISALMGGYDSAASGPAHDETVRHDG